MMKSIPAALTLVFSAFLPTALAHGRVNTVTIDGQEYKGPDFNDKSDSVVRMITTPSPVQDLTSDDLICGQGAANNVAALSAAAKPGSTVAYTWDSGSPPIPWPHNVGPLMTYITSCGGNCTSFSGKGAKWTKIDEAGRPNNATTGDWIQATTYHVNKPYSFKLPSDLPDGEYLLRHEIIALHNAQNAGGAELYPSCTQITVSGGSNAKIAVPSNAQDTFPGSYSSTEPGILVDVYSGALNYKFPGGPLFADVTGTGSTSGSGSSSDNTGGSSPSTTASASASLTATTSKASPTTTSSAAAADSTDGADCDDDGSDDGADDGDSDDGTTDSGVVTVTVVQTVTVTPTATMTRETKTMTEVETVTATASSLAGRAVVPPGVHGAGNKYPRQISRIMGRRSHM